jgi:capsular exopolysaccharide synthesis family protein
MVSNNVSVLDAPTRPLAPIKPKSKLNILIGGLFGLFFGVGAAFFLDYLDNTFRTPEDLERVLGVSVLGLIPKMQPDGLGARAVTEAYQSLRTSVIFSSKNHRRRVILLTSTGPQEGKSSTTSNLGRALAAAGDRVIIVDGDLRRPTQHTIHGKEREPGLTNYLAAPLDAGHQDIGWSPYVRMGDPPNLHLLPCGPIPPSPPELLGSDRFLDLVTALRESYDWVLLDSPPAATLADATQLASVADMVVLVVRHAHTDRDLVGKTLQRLRAVNPNVVGAVLNNVDIARASSKDYYYAGAYYYETPDAKKRTPRKRSAESKAVG